MAESHNSVHNSIHNSVHEGIKTIQYENQDNQGHLKTEGEEVLRKPTEESPIKQSNIEIEQKSQPKSIYGAIFAMSTLSIGTGCLTFTKKAIQLGFVWFGVLLIIAGLAMYWTLYGLIRVAKKKGDTEYSSTVLKILGKGPAILVDVMNALYSWGIIIAFEVIINSSIGRIIYIFFIDKNIYQNFAIYEKEKWNKIKITAIVMVVLNVLLFPLCLAKDIGKMKIFSIFGLVALTYTILVLIIECPFFYSHFMKNVYIKEDESTHPNWVDISRAFNSNLDFCTAFCTILYSYANHQGALPVQRSLQTDDDKLMSKVLRRSTLLTLFLYFVIFVSSFLTSPIKSEDLVIFRESIFSNDIFMNIAKIAIILELFFLVPANFNSVRCSVFHIIFGNEEVRTIPNIILSSSALILAGLIGGAYRDILNYISLLGGFCCTTTCFLIPGWMMIKVEWNEMSKIVKILTFIGITILCIIGYTGGIESVIVFFK